MAGYAYTHGLLWACWLALLYVYIAVLIRSLKLSRKSATWPLPFAWTQDDVFSPLSPLLFLLLLLLSDLTCLHLPHSELMTYFLFKRENTWRRDSVFPHHQICRTTKNFQVFQWLSLPICCEEHTASFQSEDSPPPCGLDHTSSCLFREFLVAFILFSISPVFSC